MSAATQNTIKQMKLITSANREHCVAAAGLIRSLDEVRAVSDRNVRRARLAPSVRGNGRARNGR
jgi:hypothetical protein